MPIPRKRNSTFINIKEKAKRQINRAHNMPEREQGCGGIQHPCSYKKWFSISYDWMGKAEIRKNYI